MRSVGGAQHHKRSGRPKLGRSSRPVYIGILHTCTCMTSESRSVKLELNSTYRPTTLRSAPSTTVSCSKWSTGWNAACSMNLDTRGGHAPQRSSLPRSGGKLWYVMPHKICSYDANKTNTALSSRPGCGGRESGDGTQGPPWLVIFFVCVNLSCIQTSCD